jgi:hypothetical protein
MIIAYGILFISCIGCIVSLIPLLNGLKKGGFFTWGFKPFIVSFVVFLVSLQVCFGPS